MNNNERIMVLPYGKYMGSIVNLEKYEDLLVKICLLNQYRMFYLWKPNNLHKHISFVMQMSFLKLQYCKKKSWSKSFT